MKTYRVPPESLRSKDTIILRAYALVAVVVFVVSGLVLWRADEVSHEARHLTAWIVGAFIVAGVLGAFWLAFREGQRSLKLSLEYLLDEDSITARRPGWPDVSIPLDSLSTVSEHPRFGLNVVGGQPPSHIAIPPEVSGFQELKAQLLKGRPAQPWKKSTMSLVTAALNLAVLGACIAIFLSKDSRVVVPLTALVFLAALNSYHWMWKKFALAQASTRTKMGLFLIAGVVLLILSFWLLVRQRILGP